MRPRFNVEGVSISPDHFIGGQRVTSDKTFQTRCPFNWDHLLGQISRGDAQTAKLAVDAAEAAFPAWASLTAKERGARNKP